MLLCSKGVCNTRAHRTPYDTAPPRTPISSRPPIRNTRGSGVAKPSCTGRPPGAWSRQRWVWLYNSPLLSAPTIHGGDRQLQIGQVRCQKQANSLSTPWPPSWVRTPPVTTLLWRRANWRISTTARQINSVIASHAVDA